VGWTTYIVNETGRDLYCFWATGPGVTDFPGWDMVNFRVPAGHSCSSNRGGMCLFAFGAMFEPYPVPANVVGSGPLGTPSLASGQPITGAPSASTGTLPTPDVRANYLGSALNGVPLLWGNYSSNAGNACSNWGFRIQQKADGFQHTFSAFSGPTTVWTYPGPTPFVVESQGWTSGPGMYATYPASTSGCSDPNTSAEIGI
jgi:hypothetical protein